MQLFYNKCQKQADDSIQSKANTVHGFSQNQEGRDKHPFSLHILDSHHNSFRRINGKMNGQSQGLSTVRSKRQEIYL